MIVTDFQRALWSACLRISHWTSSAYYRRCRPPIHVMNKQVPSENLADPHLKCKKKRLVYVQMTSYTLIRVTIFTSLSDKKQHIWFLYRSKESQTSAALARVKPTPTRNDTTWTTGQIDVVVTWNIKKTTFSRHRKLGFIVNYWFTPVHSLDVPTLNLSLANSLSRGKKSKSCLPHDKNRRLLNFGEFAIQLQKDDIYIQIVKTSFEK